MTKTQCLASINTRTSSRAATLYVKSPFCWRCQKINKALLLSCYSNTFLENKAGYNLWRSTENGSWFIVPHEATK